MALHPNLKLLSNSGVQNLHQCPRMYELDRMRIPGTMQQDTIHTMFGKAVGVGVQELLTHGDMDRSLFMTFLTWKWDIEYEDIESKKAKKDLWDAIHAVEQFELLKKTVFSNMEILMIDGKPATEVGFSIDCGDGFVYRSFIDALMLDKMKNEVVVVENKTKKTYEVKEAMFKNAGQSLGYAVLVDMMVARLGLQARSSYRVLYPVYQTLSREWAIMPFVKSDKKRALWIKNMLMDIRRIEDYGDEDFFPMYGESCFSFGRVCPHYDVCDYPNAYLFKPEEVPLKKDEKHRYNFHFSLEELIDQQISKGKVEVA